MMLRLGTGAAVISLALVLTGCSGSDGAAHPDGTSPAGSSTAASATATPTPTPTPTLEKDLSANAIAAAVRTKVATITDVVALTAETDSNQLLGRPNGYTQATVLSDSHGACPPDGPGTDCGATIEVWGSQSDAQARSDYIQSILKQSPELGSEYDTVGGNVLLRVTGKLTPDQAKPYQEAFAAYVGS